MDDDLQQHWQARRIQDWLALVGSDVRGVGRSSEDLLRTVGSVCRGTVKFYRDEKGWGGIESADSPFDVWVHFSVIEGTGYRSLAAGDAVEFRWEPARQESWLCVATWVRKIGHG